MAGQIETDDSYIGGLDAIGSEEEKISDEDRGELLRSIDLLTAPRQAPVEREARPRSRGLLLPVLVPAVSAAIMVAAVFFSEALLGSRGDLAGDSAQARAGEGRVLDAYRRESEARIAQKDAVIFGVLDRLGSLENERRDLARLMEARVRQRQDELEQAAAQSLRAQKEKLASDGIAALEAEQRLRELSDRLRRERETELATYRQQSEELARRRDQQLLREQEAARSAVASLGGDAAAAATQRDQGAGDTIGRSLIAAAAALQRGDYAGALETLATLRALLDDPALAALPSVAARRASDLAVVEALRGDARRGLEAASARESRASAPPAPPAPPPAVSEAAESSALRMLGMVTLVDGRSIVVESVAAVRVREGSPLEIRRPSGAGASTLVARATVSSVSGRRILAQIDDAAAAALPLAADQVFVVTALAPR